MTYQYATSVDNLGRLSITPLTGTRIAENL